MDFLKGIAILATVIGHLTADIPAAVTLFNIIHSFHMPLLFFVSAYVEEENKDKYAGRKRNMLQNRASGILLPYIVWSVLYLIFRNGSFSNIKIENIMHAILLGYEGNGLWFLAVLFGLKIMHFLYWKLCEAISKKALWKNILIVCSLEGIIVLLAVITKQAFIVNMMSYAIPYFLAIMTVDSEWVQKTVESEWLVAGAMLIYAVVLPSFSFSDVHWMTQVIRIGLSCCVIVVCLKLHKIWQPSHWNKVICLYGKYSMAIYLLHGFFMDEKVYLYDVDSGFVVLLLSLGSSLIVALICVVLAKLVEVSSWWTKILFGK